jgi:hypothetical protein
MLPLNAPGRRDKYRKQHRYLPLLGGSMGLQEFIAYMGIRENLGPCILGLLAGSILLYSIWDRNRYFKESSLDSYYSLAIKWAEKRMILNRFLPQKTLDSINFSYRSFLIAIITILWPVLFPVWFTYAIFAFTFVFFMLSFIWNIIIFYIMSRIEFFRNILSLLGFTICRDNIDAISFASFVACEIIGAALSYPFLIMKDTLFFIRINATKENYKQSIENYIKTKQRIKDILEKFIFGFVGLIVCIYFVINEGWLAIFYFPVWPIVVIYRVLREIPICH